MTTTAGPRDLAADSPSRTTPCSHSRMDTNPIDLGCIEVLQVLDEQGNVNPSGDPELSDDDLRAVHRAMVLTRAFDARMLTMQRQGEMGTFAPNLGQEACMIGQVWELTKQDWFSPSYRSFGAQIHRGWPMERLLLLWAGYHEGFPPPEGVNDMPFSIVIGSHVLPSVGIAMGMRRQRNKDCVVVNFGDGAMSQGSVSEALNFAMVDRAPIVFVCENNGWAISTPTTLQYATNHLAGRGIAFGLPSIRVDGNDILGMISAMRKATERARNGEGPTFIEAITYRVSLHTTADDPKVYREESDTEPWHQRCPITRLERLLEQRGLMTKDAAEAVKNDCDSQVLEARERFRKIAKARPREVFDHIYKTTPSELENQRDEYLRRLDRKGVD